MPQQANTTTASASISFFCQSAVWLSYCLVHLVDLIQFVQFVWPEPVLWQDQYAGIQMYVPSSKNELMYGRLDDEPRQFQHDIFSFFLASLCVVELMVVDLSGTGWWLGAFFSFRFATEHPEHFPIVKAELRSHFRTLTLYDVVSGVFTKRRHCDIWQPSKNSNRLFPTFSEFLFCTCTYLEALMCTTTMRLQTWVSSLWLGL